MSRTFVRQDTQIRSSDVYDDTIAPAEATFETNPTNIEENLNHLRSQISNLFDDRAGDWFIDLNVPSTLETGSQRGVNDLNTSLHALEKKRVLRAIKLLDDVVVTAAVAADATLTGTANFADTETIVIGTKTYTFQDSLTDVDGNVDVGVDLATSLDNLRAAINLDAGAGSAYAASMTLHPDVSATDTATTIVALAKTSGTQGNAIATDAAGSANATWDGPLFLTGGAGGDVEILAAGELPSQTTAAVGAVTTLGTVVAAAAAFAVAGLDEVAGLHALAPKNLAEILDGDTGDPMVTVGSGTSPAGKKIWALLQGESGVTDGVTITDTTNTRVQLSFVIANDTNDDLILVDGIEMGGKTINYCYRERIRLEDLNEGDFLNSAAIDIGAGAVTPTRQNSYDNQGVTPVELLTNADLDLAGGIEWAIRDLANADLLKISEGSGGGTTELAIESDVDTFRADAVVNDFDNGASFDTGSAGTTIDIGVTAANAITSGGALLVKTAADTDLTLFGDREVILNDENFTDEGTWTGPGVKVSDTTAEVVAYESAFGGEVSLINAIVQAAGQENRTKGTAVVQTANHAAGTNITGAGGGPELDAQLPDYSSVASFLADVDVFLNGVLMRGDDSTTGANDHDVYPGDTPADGDIKFEFIVKGLGTNPDVITMIVYGA